MTLKDQYIGIRRSEIQPEHYNALNNLGTMHLETLDLQAAEESFKSAIHLTLPSQKPIIT